MDAYRPLLIAGLVVTEVAIWQWRMVIAHRGSRVSAMLLGIVGAVLQITAITQVVAAPNPASQGPPKRLRVLHGIGRPIHQAPSTAEELGEDGVDLVRGQQGGAVAQAG
jgi:hypothetical protein